MRKINIRVSDAIPEMPFSFEQTVERTLKKVCAEPKKQTRTEQKTVTGRWVPDTARAQNRKKTPRTGRIFAYGAVAVLLVGVFALGAFVLRNALYGGRKTGELTETATEQPAVPYAASPAIRCFGLTYLLTDGVYSGEVTESEMQKAASLVPISEWPTEDGQANFGEAGMPYAMTPDGLVVQFDGEWRFCEPRLPDATGLFEAAYAQAISEQDALNQAYARLKRDGEETDDEVEANEFFLHQRLVRLQWICDTYRSAIPVVLSSLWLWICLWAKVSHVLLNLP